MVTKRINGSNKSEALSIDNSKTFISHSTSRFCVNNPDCMKCKVLGQYDFMTIHTHLFRKTGIK